MSYTLDNNKWNLKGPNFVENKAYDFENNNKSVLNFYDNSRKNIISSHLPQSAQLKYMVVEKQPDCQNCNDNDDTTAALTLIVENRGYDFMAAAEPHSQSNDKSAIQMKRISQKGGKHLTSSDLLSFAKQIATGMVNIQKSCNKFIRKINY